jgi:hypothetical protein
MTTSSDAIQKDRLQALRESNLTGIDFVEVVDPQDQTQLRVHFHKDSVPPLQGTITAVQITGGETGRIITVYPIDDAQDWSTDAEGRPLLTLTVAEPGDFSDYTLILKSDRLDPFFAQVTFSFKALCPSDLDCQTPPLVCPPLEEDRPLIDYLAKDFLSFRKALSDFSALRYPAWQERSEADFGVMLMEALCALADDFSYLQDRIAAEATLDTATQRRSMVRHARLVDYEPRPATAARVWLQLDVVGGPIPPGLVVSAQAPDGAVVEFETGEGLVDPHTGRLDHSTYPVDRRWNRGIKPYFWDDSQLCLGQGATDMWVEGQDFGLTQGQPLLIETSGTSPADPKVAEIVHLVDDCPAVKQTDPLFHQPVTHIFWRTEDALKFDHDLTRTVLAGNLVPAVQGRRYTEAFSIPEDSPPISSVSLSHALVRTGPNSTPDHVVPQYLYPLRQVPLAWLPPADATTPPLPEVVLLQQQGDNTTAWTWRRSLLQAERFEPAFTLDPVRFSRIAQIREGGDTTDLYDYDGDDGYTIRFGDGSFGNIPLPGSTFQVTYRVGGGTIGNVAADSIRKVDPAAAAWIQAVTNPFPAAGGTDEESIEQVQRLAPYAFRAQQLRAVRAADYQAAAQTLPWVQRAGTTFRWTGSWLTVFTTPDPKGSEVLTPEQQTDILNLLNRYRLAGYESYVLNPRYASLDLQVVVCACTEAFQGEVKASILAALSATRLSDGTLGFFHPDRWTFGMPLERSALAAAIQDVIGVAGVVSIQYRQRGLTPDYLDLPESLTIPADVILRLNNDPNRPDHGLLKISVEGGK